MMRLKYQFQLIQAIRDFFLKEEFIDVLTPPMVENPGMETHIHPFEVMSKIQGKALNRYLHTSPEFAMKKLISLQDEELDKIFQISYCFRDEPSSEIHRNQFLMLEWYRKNARYEKIMDDCEALITWCLKDLQKKSLPVKFQKLNFTKLTVQELFQKTIQID
ncbi:MAG: hypothetical protein JNM93_01400, partial [Bacteriovoracaceae bacterium]|nr:hypothetical protein [Bacteriovoracaceae bacterium]